MKTKLLLISLLVLSNTVFANDSASYVRLIDAAKRLDVQTGTVSQEIVKTGKDSDKHEAVKLPGSTDDPAVQEQGMDHDAMVQQLADQKPNIYDTNSSLKQASESLLKAFKSEEVKQ